MREWFGSHWNGRVSEVACRNSRLGVLAVSRSGRSPFWSFRRDFPGLKTASLQPFLVKNIFTDFKRHDLGPDFYERNYDGTVQKQMLTTPLWGVGSTAPYGHDGRSINLHEVILRHGGEAQQSRDFYAILPPREQNAIVAFLQTLVLFPPDDTAFCSLGGRIA